MDISTEKQHVFIIGSKGIPANYGGFETFVEKLTQYQINKNIQYHVSCAVDDISEGPIEFEHNGAHCFNIVWKKTGSSKAIFYDIDAIKWSIDYVKKNNIKKPIFYVLACRVGPFMGHYKKKIIKLDGRLFVNPDGHEWMRKKWSYLIRRYWKISEILMVKSADLLICDSKNIKKYIDNQYTKFNPKTVFIAYGAETRISKLGNNDLQLTSWYDLNKLTVKEYYLVVGRFVPENNYEIMINEFMKSKTEKNFALITNVSEEFLEELKIKTKFNEDSRIKFVGTVYDQELLKKIRENAYGYFHGHEVGGTNPSLLEALASTDLNLLLNVGFNKEVAEDSAVYWDKTNKSLAKLIDTTDKCTTSDILYLGNKAKNRISSLYNWDYIVGKYENIFLNKN